MAITLSTIESKVRYLLGEFAQEQKDIFTYTSSSIFTLTEDNPILVSTVLKNDVELDSGDWSYSTSTNKVTISASLTTSDTVEIQYNYYPNYSSTEIQSYIQAALVHISAANYFTWAIQTSTIYPEPSLKEQDLIAMIAAILIEPDNRTMRFPDFSITAPSDMPTHEKVRKTISVFKHNSHGIFFLGSK